MAVNTSAEAARLLQQAAETAKQAEGVIQNLIVEHDYQDVAQLIARAAQQLLNAGALLMQSEAEDALDSLEAAEETLDSVYAIIDAETDDE